MGLMTTADFASVVTRYLCTGRRDAQENACLLLEKLSLEEGLKESIGVIPGVKEALIHMLGDERHPKPIKLATKTLLALCLLRDNRRRAVEVGAVASLVEMLPRARAETESFGHPGASGDDRSRVNNIVWLWSVVNDELEV